MKTNKDIIVLTGAGQLGMAIIRRMGYGNKIFVADWKLENAQAIAKTLTEAGFDVVPFKVDISSRASVLELIEAAQKEGEISMFINAAGVSPSQASIEHILHVDLYGTSLLLEEFGKVIKTGGTGCWRLHR
jgi:NADP-dependent 3-hydroxy acid dehydrogenase YdfG